ncbi:MAG TPA: VRR-NUC domain-containing protein [Bacteroidetes bacterium]|nr:VRR-NUC domain-containing protein [Bacteroidota bacterium]
MNNPEHLEQVALFQWASLNDERIPELKLMFHIPNGGHRHKAVAAKMKAEGVKAGVPDILLACPRDGFHGLFIEMKAGKNRTTKSQNEWIQRLLGVGYLAVVCYGFEEAKKEIMDYLDWKEVDLTNG